MNRAMLHLPGFALVALAFTPVLRADPTSRPFQWNRELREGTMLSERDFPATFRAPMDMVYRLWKESGGWRLEARSYRTDTLVVSMATLTNRRESGVDGLRTELLRECASEPRSVVNSSFSSPSSIELECRLAGSEPPLLAQLRLVPLPPSGEQQDRAVPQRFLFVMAIARPSDRELLQMLEIRPSHSSAGP